jgi:predicted dehydrogenase
MKLRVGIVGLGSQWDTRYLPALRSLADRYEVRGVCEQVSHLAKRAAAELGTVAVDGYRALAARDFGKAVYSAISFPVDPDEARLLRSRVDEAGIAFMAELPRRYAPATLRLKELIATQIGVPRMLFCHRRVPLSQTPMSPPPRDGASEARDLMELVDWCRYVAGAEPTSVVAVRHAEVPGGDVDDYQMMSLDFGRPPPCRRCASGASPSSTCRRASCGSTGWAAIRSRSTPSGPWASTCSCNSTARSRASSAP